MDYGPDHTSDLVISRLAFYGLACHLTKRVDATDPNKPAGAMYVNDVTALSQLKVRAGYEIYGSKAYFNANQVLIGVYVSYDHSTRKPDHPLWEEAKFVWKASTFVLVTFRDHLLHTHLTESNTLTKAVHAFPADHWIRLNFKPFTFRANIVNLFAARTLIVNHGAGHRIWAFEDMKKVVEMGRAYSFEDRERFIDQSMIDDNNSHFPIREDHKRYVDIVKKFVSTIYTIHQNDDQSIDKFLGIIGKGLNISNHSIESDFVRVVTQLIVGVTGIHQHVGQASDYVTGPDFLGVRIKKGASVDSIQAHCNLVALVSSTGTLQPYLLEGWDQLFEESGRDLRDRMAYVDFQGSLKDWAIEVSRLNDAAGEDNPNRKFPFRSFDPSVLNCAVSK